MAISTSDKYVEITRDDGSKLTIPRDRAHELETKQETKEMATPQQPPFQSQSPGAVTREELQGLQDNVKRLTDAMSAQNEAVTKMLSLTADSFGKVGGQVGAPAMFDALPAAPEKGMIKKIGSSMVEAAIAGAKMYGADTLIERQDQIYLAIAEGIASRKFMAKLPFIGARIKRAEVKRFMESIPVKVGKFTMNALALVAVSESEMVPESIRGPVVKSLQGAMALQSKDLTKRIGDPAVKAGFTFVESVSRFLSGSHASLGETIRAQIPSSVSDNQ